MMTCSWTDGSTFVSTGHTLLSSHQEKTILGFERKLDRRPLAGRSRVCANLKGTEAMLELIKDAQHAGISAYYVLFDTWICLLKSLSANCQNILRELWYFLNQKHRIIDVMLDFQGTKFHFDIGSFSL